MTKVFLVLLAAAFVAAAGVFIAAFMSRDEPRTTPCRSVTEETEVEP